MLKQFFIYSLLSLALFGCNMDHKTPTTKAPDQGAFDQGENEIDREITQTIRQMLMADRELSVEAKNVTIITKNGAVTLRGVVATAMEKKDIADKAQATAGVKNVKNELVVSQ
ncbi:putative hyperosmotically inducible periplasmic protein [Chlamydiales bacterium STE3]|nr:putative hyperosmotically inducible periplasmic protein [Chlamydiales bacterium STE3]